MKIRNLILVVLLFVNYSCSLGQVRGWKISNLNGYNYYGDRIYNSHTFFNDGSALTSLGQRMFTFVGLVPQPAVSYYFPNFVLSAELRGTVGSYSLPDPTCNFNYEGYPVEREDVASSFLVGRHLKVRNAKHEIYAGYSHRWTMYTLAIGICAQNHLSVGGNYDYHDNGFQIKYMVSWKLGNLAKARIGGGVNYISYSNTPNTVNAGLYLSYSFLTKKDT